MQNEKTRKFGVLSKQGGDLGGREEVELIDSSKRASAPHLLTSKPLNTFRREESTFFGPPHIIFISKQPDFFGRYVSLCLGSTGPRLKYLCRQQWR